jgi:hypothetical protein
MTRNARSLLGLATALVTYLALSIWYWVQIGPFIIDDAFIFFRYAENFARGHGFVYNVGEPVEGYTSFLWVLVLGVLRWCGLELVAAAKILGVLLGAATITLTWFAARTLFPSLGFAGALPSLYLASNRTFCVWSVEGMDAKVFGAVIVAAFVAWLRYGSGVVWKWIPATGILVGLLPLARPEGYLVAGVLAVAALAEATRAGRFRGFALNATAAALVAGSHLVYRLITYEDVVPNTFHAKVVGLQLANGLRYLNAFLTSNSLYLFGILTVVGAALFLVDSRDSAARRFVVVWVLLHTAYLVAIGGDYFEFRFIDAALPFVGLLTLRGCVALGNRLSTSTGRSAALLILGVTWIGLNAQTVFLPIAPREWLTTPEREREFTEEFDRAARWIADHLDPEESIAISPAGVIAYRSPERYVLDLFGLNDREIARTIEPATGYQIGHQREVSHDYVRERGISYFIGHPRFVEKPWAPGRVASVEVEPGLYFLLMPLQPTTRYRARIYRLPRGEGPAGGP